MPSGTWSALLNVFHKNIFDRDSVQFSSVAQSCPTLCNLKNCSTPGFPVHHQLLELLKFMSTESVMPFNHLILCHPLLLPPSVFPSIRIFSNESVLRIRWPDSNTSATWCEELTHWKRLWCWERFRAGGEGFDRGWDGWMTSPTWWTWVWVNSGNWWWTGRPGLLLSMGS